MNSFYSVLTIALYETKTLFRSWFFRIFTIISLAGLFVFDLEALLELNGGVGFWSMRALPSVIPYVNLLFLNVVQAIIAIFLASDFLKRDKKLDTSEVIYVRPMSNSEYVVGKTIGNLFVFLLLNVLVLLIALLFNFLSPEVAIAGMTYAYYFVLISIPTLVFILGLAFVVMSLVRNQAVTFVLLLGYVAISLFYLKGKFYGLFDYMAFHSPMTYSDFVGFGNLKAIVIQRGMYFILGVGFICLTVFWLKRLAREGWRRYLSAIAGIICLAVGIYLGILHVQYFTSGRQLRASMLKTDDQYAGVLPVRVQDYDIHLVHQRNSIQCNVTMAVQNEDSLPAKQLVFSLNPGLKIQKLLIDGKEHAFQRKYELVSLTNFQLQPGEKAKIQLNYSGTINEQACYLDIDEETRAEEYSNFSYQIDKRYAFISPDYVLLTREANWYPIAGAGYGMHNKQWFSRQFSHYSLTVKTAPGLTVISQGTSKKQADGVTFTSSHKQCRISLIIGKYKELGTTVNGIKFQVYTLPEHDYFSRFFGEIKDTIPGIITDELADFERNVDLYYPFGHFSLVEVPVQYFSYDRIYTGAREQAQPGMILFPEKGVLMDEADFNGRMKQTSRRFGFGRNSQDQTPEEKKIQLFRNFIAQLCQEKTRPDFSFSKGQVQVKEKVNPYFIFPLFYTYAYYLESERWPITDRVLESYKKSGLSDDNHMGWMRNIQGMSEDEKANLALLSNSFQSILDDPDSRQIADNVIQLKGETLFSVIKQKTGGDQFADFLYGFLSSHQFQRTSVTDFNGELNHKFGIDLLPFLKDWFTSVKLPAFLIGKVQAFQVLDDQQQKTMIRVKVTNASDQEGVLTVSFRLGGGRGSRFGGMGGQSQNVDRQVYLKGNQTKLVSFLMNGTPRQITVNTLASRNIPSEIDLPLGTVKDNSSLEAFDGEKIVDSPVRMAEDGEIIEDNEDPGFRVDYSEKPSLLRRLLVPNEDNKTKYSGFSGWRPPRNWTLTTNSSFYGAFVRSAYYIRSGEGNRKVSWHIPIKEAGYYQVYAYVYKDSRGPRRHSESGSYHYIIHHDDGNEEAEMDLQSASAGWNSLGNYYFSPDTAVIELTNQSEARLVVADAIKLIKQ